MLGALLSYHTLLGVTAAVYSLFSVTNYFMLNVDTSSCLQIENLSSTLAPILIELLQANIPTGVQMAIKPVSCMCLFHLLPLNV